MTLAGPFKTVDLTGMGEDYEEECQRMLWRGVAYLAEAKPPTSMWKDAKSYKGIYGVLSTAGEHLKGLEAAMMRGNGATGAMHQCVMGHLAYIHENGQDAWYEHVIKHREPNGIYEWEGEL